MSNVVKRCGFVLCLNYSRTRFGKLVARQCLTNEILRSNSGSVPDVPVSLSTVNAYKLMV